jgi:hypothetical protein
VAISSAPTRFFRQTAKNLAKGFLLFALASFWDNICLVEQFVCFYTPTSLLPLLGHFYVLKGLSK